MKHPLRELEDIIAIPWEHGAGIVVLDPCREHRVIVILPHLTLTAVKDSLTLYFLRMPTNQRLISDGNSPSNV